MWSALFSLLASAAPDLPFPRVDDAPKAQVYAEVSGDGPVVGKWRRRTGPIRAWAFADGVIEHYERWNGKVLAERKQYDAVGRPLSTVVYGDAGPVEVRLHAPDGALVPVTAWEVRELGGWRLRLPPGSMAAADGTLTWNDGVREVVIQLVATPADPFSDAFGEGLATTCGCLIEGRTTAWVDGRAGSLYQVRLPAPGTDLLGALWAVGHGDAALLVAVRAPEDVSDGTGALAFGRAVTALLSWAGT